MQRLVLLPGLLHDVRIWQPQAAALADSAHIFIGDLTQGDSIAAMATHVLDTAPSETFALAGLSMGGYVALEIMRQAPARVTGLALLDTSARPDTPTAIENRIYAIHSARTDFAQVVDDLIPKQITADHCEDEKLVALIKDMAHNLGIETFIRQQIAITNRIDSLPFLRNIKCPTLVLCGREDVITPLGLHQEMVSEIAGAGLAIVNDCGHLSTIEQPLRVNEAMAQWLETIQALGT